MKTIREKADELGFTVQWEHDTTVRQQWGGNIDINIYHNDTWLFLAYCTPLGVYGAMKKTHECLDRLKRIVDTINKLTPELLPKGFSYTLNYRPHGRVPMSLPYVEFCIYEGDNLRAQSCMSRGYPTTVIENAVLRATRQMRKEKQRREFVAEFAKALTPTLEQELGANP